MSKIIDRAYPFMKAQTYPIEVPYVGFDDWPDGIIGSDYHFIHPTSGKIYQLIGVLKFFEFSKWHDDNPKQELKKKHGIKAIYHDRQRKVNRTG